MAKTGSKKVKKRPKVVRKGRKHETVKQSSIYTVKGNELTKKKSCPRCGDGTTLAQHSNRAYCGRCGYTIFEKRDKQEEKPTENKQEEKPTENKQEEKPIKQEA